MKRLFTVCTLLAVCMAALLVGPTSSQAALSQADRGVGTQTTCYGGAVPFEVKVAGTLVGPGEISYTDPYTASKRCKDINIKYSSNPHATYVSAFRCRDNYQFTTW